MNTVRGRGFGFQEAITKDRFKKDHFQKDDKKKDFKKLRNNIIVY